MIVGNKRMGITDTSLTKEQYSVILNHIWKHHRFARGGRNIKYIRPSWDMRDGKCFYVDFDSKDFDFRDDTEVPMFKRIMDWLAEVETKPQGEVSE